MLELMNNLRDKWVIIKSACGLLLLARSSLLDLKSGFLYPMGDNWAVSHRGIVVELLWGYGYDFYSRV